MSRSSRVSKRPEKSEHGTGPDMLEIERKVIDRCDLDPFTSETFNLYVGAARIITEEMNAWATPWHPDLPAPNHFHDDDRRLSYSVEVWHINPPGDAQGENVPRAWRTLLEYQRRGAFRAAWWVGFSLDHLGRLQRVGAPTHPLRLPTLVFHTRKSYRDEKTLELQGQPDRSSYLTLLTSEWRLLELFEAAAQGHGHVINEGRRP